MFRPFGRALTIALVSLFSGLGTAAHANSSDYLSYPAQDLALTNATVIDGTGKPLRKQQTILISDGKITAIQAATAAIPDGFTALDLSGHTVLPGLVMMHEHMFYPTGKGNYTEMLFSFPKLYLAGGATTIRTAGTTAPYGDLNLAYAVSAGKTIGPDMDVTAPYLNGPGLPLMKLKALRDANNAKAMMDYWQSEGVNSFKLYMQIRTDEMQTVLDLAHSKKQKVTGHLCSITLGQAADMGIDNLEHGFVTATDFVEEKENDKCPSGKAVRQSLLDLPLDSPKMAKLINKLVDNDVAITSTLTIYETFAKGRPVVHSKALDQLTTEVRGLYLDRWSSIQQGDDESWTKLFKKEMAWEKQFVDAGGTLLVGTDPTGYGGVVAGWSNLRALELLQEAGFSLEQTVKIATLNGATFLEQQDSIGTIEVGKRANLAIFNSDLSSDNGDVTAIRYSVKDGNIYDSQKIFNSLKGIVGLH